MRTRHASLLLYLGCALLALAPACGGGGGGGGGVVLDAFNGTYHWSQIIGDAGPPLRGTGLWGNMTSDGSGMVTGGTTWTISNGVVMLPKSVTPTAYALPGGGRLQWLAGGVPFAEGGVSSDGQHAVLGAVNAGGDPSIALFTRYASGLSNASLNGTYHFAEFVTAPSGTGDGVLWGTAVFDGAGGVTFTLLANFNGTLSGPTGAAELYSVASDGTLTFGIGTEDYRGSVRQDGQVAFFSGGTGAGDGAALGVMIKYSTAATDATFSGLYHLVVMEADELLAPAINWSSLTGTASATGAGTYSIPSLTRLQDDGTLDTPLTGVLPYAVSSSGGIALGGGRVGAVSADGTVAAVVGGTLANMDAFLHVMIR